MKKTEQILQDLRLSEKRMRHTLGVAEAALMLAERHFPELNPETVEIAALMHDYTKELSKEEQLALCERYHLEVTEEERECPKLLHSKTAAAIAEHVYHFSEEICSAIRWHTTGKPDMSPLEIVIYLADFIEKNRTFSDCVKIRDYYNRQYEKRKKKEKALYLTLQKSFDVSIKELVSNQSVINMETIRARNYYINLLNQ